MEGRRGAGTDTGSRMGEGGMKGTEPTVEEIRRKLQEAGAKVNNSCGIHVYVDASAHTVTTLRNIVNIMAAKEICSTRRFR